MVAKVIAHGRTRGDAIKIMRRALAEYRISGIKTNISFQQEILNNPHFCSGNIDTQFVYKRMTPIQEAECEIDNENKKYYSQG
jgi:acetyl-CoA carboxylase biotin carboxylase subunit